MKTMVRPTAPAGPGCPQPSSAVHMSCWPSPAWPGHWYESLRSGRRWGDAALDVERCWRRAIRVGADEASVGQQPVGEFDGRLPVRQVERDGGQMGVHVDALARGEVQYSRKGGPSRIRHDPP